MLSASPRARIDLEQVAYLPVRDAYFRGAHGAGANFVSIEEEHQLFFANAEIFIQLEAAARKAVGLGKAPGSRQIVVPLKSCLRDGLEFRKSAVFHQIGQGDGLSCAAFEIHEEGSPEGVDTTSVLARLTSEA